LIGLACVRRVRYSGRATTWCCDR